MYWIYELWQRNQTRIDGLGIVFFAAAMTLVLQLVLWACALGTAI